MISLIRKRMRGDKGFTLIELLVVIIIIAILAAIAIPTFLGQRQKAQDSAAKSLCRNAMTAVESAFVDTRDFSDIAAADLLLIEPSIAFLDGAAGCSAAPVAQADDDEVDYAPVAGSDAYEVGTQSLSEETFGVYVNKTANPIGANLPGNTFYVGGAIQDW